ncbi:MAG TPA: alpha/beta hydrolase [Gemmatimonadaceae bacterium]|nr:alpha/beta hydrolase [Gemmatimonadaceae bacterium]
MRLRHLWLLFATTIFVSGSVAAQIPVPSPRIELRRCRSPSANEEARCGTISLPENRALRAGRVVRLDVVILPALDSARDEPILFLHGGPGLPATRADSYVEWALQPLRGTHDLVMVDMRGTGGDDRLVCDLYNDHGRIQPYLEPMFPIARVRACAARLAARADLTQYTTEIAAQDLDDVRAALHIERWSLFGGSYGTRLALAYMRLFPTRVGAAALLGVIPPEAPIGRDFAVGGEAALDSAFAACATDARCHAAVPDPRGDVANLLERLRHTPAHVTLWNGRRLWRESVTLNARAAAELLWYEANQPASLMRVLPLVHRAVRRDDFAPLIRQLAEASRARRSGRGEGLMLSVLCAEDAPRLAGVGANTDTLLLGSPVVPELLEACRAWPRGTVSPRFGDRVVSAIPTLLISGGRDPTSPPYLADLAAAGLSGSVRYDDPRAGHAALDARSLARLAEFFELFEAPHR